MNKVVVRNEECKGCKICISVCPTKSLTLSGHINSSGYEYVSFLEGSGCTACGLCFFNCPELGALTVYHDKEKSK
jgi:NAD-dependent dihydropyrimidine dehydrogenase PreA subunit